MRARGRKFRPEELRKHKEQWLEICASKPEIFINASRDSDVGPLQALIDELEFNTIVAQYHGSHEQGCPFLTEQSHRAIREGVISTLNEELKQTILDAYQAIGKANQLVVGAALQHSAPSWGDASGSAMEAIREARPKISEAKRSLLKFLGSEEIAERGD